MKLKKPFSFTAIASAVAATLVITLSGCASSPQKNTGDQLMQKTAVEVALTKFYAEATNAPLLVQNAQGVLVCPIIKKAGFVLGGEGGTCSMQVNGATVEYYRTAAFKAGLVAGAESYSLLLIFNDANALSNFRASNGNWQVGGNLSISVAKKGAGGGFDSRSTGAAITAYVFSQRGLMSDISIDGSTFKKLQDK
ncbi:MAG: hypothetical protein methR_P1550 [Methyloprofundus sp.]|nr:MAG: hypothetical protein methR_P1550 [Methyloprofundus sp.]